MRIIGSIGRILLAVGVLVLGFVSYQLWGTGLHEQSAQKDLNKQFDQMLATGTTTPNSAPTTSTDASNKPTTTTPPKVGATMPLATEIGQPIGRLEIPKIDVNKIVVQGVPLEELDRAPGHYPQTPFPGQAGNASIAGHRTTYGAPFWNIDKLKPGDPIIITTLQGKFTYKVIWTKIVQPDAVWVLETDPDHPNTLTLTACHPRTNLTQRYIVRAVLVGNPVPRLPGQDKAMRTYAAHTNGLADGTTAASHPGAWPQVILWGLICAVIWLITWFLSRRWRRSSRRVPPRWVRTVVPYVIGVPIFCIALFFAFENLGNLLPAGL